MDTVSIETLIRSLHKPVEVCLTIIPEDEMRRGNGLLLVQLPYVEIIHSGNTGYLYWLLLLDTQEINASRYLSKRAYTYLQQVALHVLRFNAVRRTLEQDKATSFDFHISAV